MFGSGLYVLTPERVHNAAYNRVRTIEIAVAVIAPRENSLEIYIDATVENLQHLTSYTPISIPFCRGRSHHMCREHMTAI